MDHEIFKALSEPTRLRIMAMLTEGEMCVCELQEALLLPQSTVSRHMSRLKTSGLVQDSRHGKWIHYRLNNANQPLLVALKGYFRGLKSKEPFISDTTRLEQLRIRKDRCK